MAERAFDKEIWKARLREAGLRVTTSRLEVIHSLAESPKPSSALDVLASLSGRSLDRVTVYRTLNSLVEHGLAHRIDPGDRIWRYGLIGERFLLDDLEAGAAVLTVDIAIRRIDQVTVLVTHPSEMELARCDECEDVSPVIGLQTGQPSVPIRLRHPGLQHVLKPAPAIGRRLLLYQDHSSYR